MSLTLVISGGQIGADIAGLRAAKACGIKTGGMMPKGFRTLDGPLDPEIVKEFGLREHVTSAYPPRTRANVLASDATIRLAHDFTSPGERCTLRYIRELGRPYADVTIILRDKKYVINESPSRLAHWLDFVGVNILNVAGNGLQAIEPCVEDFLIQVFTLDQTPQL